MELQSEELDSQEALTTSTDVYPPSAPSRRVNINMWKAPLCNHPGNLYAGTSRQCEQVSTAAAPKPEKKELKVKDGVERAECSLGKSATLLSKTATFILVQAENIIHKKCHLVFVTSIQFFVLSDCRSIAKAYILFLAFQDKLLSEGHYYVFLKEEQRRPSKCFTSLSWGWRDRE